MVGILPAWPVENTLFHRNHVIWRTKITKFWRNGNDSKQPYWPPRCNCNIVESGVRHHNRNPWCNDVDFFKIKFVFFLYLLLLASWKKTICLYIFLISDRQWGTEHQYLFSRFLGVSIFVNSDHVPSFSCLDVWNAWQTTSGVYAITVTTSAFHSRRCGRL
jgi:hypothetical protein